LCPLSKGLPAKSACWPDGIFALPEATAGGAALLV
jgi:hypothetical protein